MIYVRGADSEIAKALGKLHPIEAVPRGAEMPIAEKYLFCVGLIRQKRIETQTPTEIMQGFMINASNIIVSCEKLIERNASARICILGSESGFKWSFDGAYAAAKAGLHRYVETRRLKYPDQQLVCVAPTCVVGTNMNNQRNEVGRARLEIRRQEHPKRRWLGIGEVARMIHFLLCVDKGYTTNVVIRLNGGEHCT